MALDRMSRDMDYAKIDRDKFALMGLMAFGLFAVVGSAHALGGSMEEGLHWGLVGIALLAIAMIPSTIFHIRYKKKSKAYGDALDVFFRNVT